MKLAALPVQESSVKLSLTVKKSTADLLDHYQACYEEEYNQEVSPRELIESMLLKFIVDDRDFQKWLAVQGKDTQAVRKQRRIARNTVSAEAQEDASDEA